MTIQNSSDQATANESVVPTRPVSVELGSPDQKTADDAIVESDEPEPKNRKALFTKILAGLILLGVIVYVIVDSQTNNHVKNGIVAFLEWIQNNLVAGVFSFVAVYFLATILWVPGSILTLGAGFVFSSALDSLGWGVLLGSVAVWFGATLGAIAAFLIGRYLFRDVVNEKLTKKYKVFEALDRAFVDQGLKITILCRLSPIIPFNAFNYAMGVTAVKFRDYCIACIAMIPGTLLYVFFGAAAGSLTGIAGGGDEDSPSNNRGVTIAIVVVGVVFGIGAIAVIVWYAKKELNKIVEKSEQEQEQSAEMSDEENNNSSSNDDNNNTLATVE
jgi:uncharacterized membrane protein YdjX (TVP38/TMEM64 family)